MVQRVAHFYFTEHTPRKGTLATLRVGCNVKVSSLATVRRIKYQYRLNTPNGYQPVLISFRLAFVLACVGVLG